MQPFLGVAVPRLNYLFTRGRAGPWGGAAGTGVGGLHAFLQELGLAARQGGLRQLGGIAYVCS